MHPMNWLIGLGCCSIFKCTQADLALTMALINTDRAENRGGMLNLFIRSMIKQCVSVLGLKMKHESIK